MRRIARRISLALLGAVLSVVLSSVGCIGGTLDSTAPDAVSDLATGATTASSVELTWTAPGDDGAVGTATVYDIRYSTTGAITSDAEFDAATTVVGEPPPSVAGSAEAMTVTGLFSSTTYWFALKTADEVLNWSGVSNSPTGTTLFSSDTTPPADVTDLAVGGETATTIDLSWTAPGDDGATGTATAYDVRYSTAGAITSDAEFNAATQATGEPPPSLSGSAEAMTVTGLTEGTPYWFALKTADEVPNWSAVSNSPTGTPFFNGFNLARSFDSSVWAVAVADDGTGDVYLGGSFVSYNSTASNRIIRLNADGSVDPGFSIGTGFDDQVRVIALATDGSGDIYVGGSFSSYDAAASKGIIRLNSDGSVDAGFDVGGGTGSVYSISPATDGSGDVYIGGQFSTYDGTASSCIARINSDGTLDAAFDVGTGFNFGTRVFSIVPTTDGTDDVYVGGSFTFYNGSGRNSLVRLNSDGTLDPAFNVGTGFDAWVLSMALAPDGSGDLYAGGFFDTYKGTASEEIIRLNSDGSVDAGFDVGSGFALGVSYVAAAEDGSEDVYVGGDFVLYQGLSEEHLIRLNSDGSKDSGFNIGAGFTVRGTGGGWVAALAPLTDGSGDLYVGGGFQDYDGTAINRIIKLNSDGSMDPGFAVDTGVGFNREVEVVRPLGDGSGRIYVGGYYFSYNGTTSGSINRLESNGSVDLSFSTGTGFNGRINDVIPAVDGSGDIYVGGNYSTYNGTSQNHIIRLNPDGTVDGSFATGSGFDAPVESVALAADGSGDIYAGGSFNQYNGSFLGDLVRLNSDGSADAAFVVAPFDGTVLTIAPADDGTGDVYVGGFFSQYDSVQSRRLVRLNSDGTRDAGFAVGSGFQVVSVYAITPTTDGSGDVYVGGTFTSYQGVTNNGIIRLNSDGTRDAGFDTGTGFGFASGTITVRAIALVTDGSGDIYVGGGFNDYNGTQVNGVVRLNSDGSMDFAFAVGSGCNDLVYTLALSANPTGRVYIGGLFLSCKDTTVDHLARLSADGTIE